MHKGLLRTGIVLAALAVILGAFGAHGLKPLLTEKELVSYETAVRYQMYHAFAILFTAILFKEFLQKYLAWAGRLFIIGIVVFSGSLFLLTFFRLVHKEGFEWLGAITPIGGICFVAGWLCLLPAIKKN